MNKCEMTLQLSLQLLQWQVIFFNDNKSPNDYCISVHQGKDPEEVDVVAVSIEKGFMDEFFEQVWY